MLTLEDRILRLELLTEIENGIPQEMTGKEEFKKYRDEHGFYGGRRKYIEDWFKKKESEPCRHMKWRDPDICQDCGQPL